jgi:dihydrofolate reductase
MTNSKEFSPITIVAAVTRKGGLGHAGELLYRISADMKHFKALTMGHPIVMGRKTYESFPGGPLPGRLNIVLTHSDIQLPEGAVAAHSPEEALAIATAQGSGSVMVIGGGEIYRMFMPAASTLVLTEIDADSPADTDTWFPEIDSEQWALSEASEPAIDARSGVGYRFATYVRLAAEE